MVRFEYQLTIVLLIFTSQVYGSCFFDLLISSSSSDNQTSNQYCEYSAIQYSINSTWTLSYPDCLTCQCSSNGLECCGYGVEAGIIEPPENCQLATGTCEVIFVQTDDPTKPCVDNYLAKPMRLYRKKKIQKKRQARTLLS